MLGAALDKWLILFCILNFSGAENNIGAGESITTLYEVFLNAVKDDHDSPQVSRRVLVNDSLYQIHINKLKDVNGLKLHNIVITRSSPDINSTIYINNPLEAKLPHPFMSLEDFKNILVQQREKDREIFMEAQKKERDSRIWAKVKAEAQTKGKQKQKGSSKPGRTTHARSILVEKITHTMRHKKQQTQEKRIATVIKAKLNIQEQISVKDENTAQHQKHAIINTGKIVTDKIKFGKLNKAKVSSKLVENDKSKYGVVRALKGETEAENKEVRLGANEKDKSPVSEEIKEKNTRKRTSEEKPTVKATTKKTASVDKTTVETFTGTLRTDDTTEATITDETTSEVITTDETSTGDITTEATITDEIISGETTPNVITTDETSTGDITTEATTTDETTTEESTTTTSPTTKEKWSRPRVFMGEQPANATDT